MTLQEWFEEKDYGIGIALFGQLSKNRILYQNLSRKVNPEKLEYELRKIAEYQGIDLAVKVADLNPNEVDPNAEKEKAESHSDQVIEQMNADKLHELEEGAEEIVSDKLNELESGAEDVVSDKLAEFESQVQEIMSGKLEVIRDGRKVKYEDLSPEMQARWNQNRDGYKEIRALHEKLKLMENATPEDRQPLTQRMCDLDDTIRDNWIEIDAYVPSSVPNRVESIDHKRIQANRKYISTNLKKLPEQTNPVKTAQVVAELQKRYDEIKASGEAVAAETIEELTKAGVTC